MSYLIKEIFYTIQGEGINCGRPSLFIRFANCNLRCTVKSQGFDCDTDFFNGTKMDLDDLKTVVRGTLKGLKPSLVVLTGGEPAFQANSDLVNYLHEEGFEVAIETNGTCPLAKGIDWVCVSPKRNTKIVISHADELKFVLAAGQTPFPVPTEAEWKLISPAFRGLEPDSEAIDWCKQFVLRNPEYRLSLQVHKIIGVR